jgi:cation/acetate symporter
MIVARGRDLCGSWGEAFADGEEDVVAALRQMLRPFCGGHMAAVNWAALLLLLLLWLGCIALALLALDWIFPRIYRSSGDGAPGLARRLPRTARRVVTEPAPAAAAVPAHHITVAPAPWLGSYWRANLRLIVTLLLIWLVSFVVPALLSGALNVVQVLTGFPLGYYMGAQGSLIVFLALIFVYAWRMAQLDGRYGLWPAAYGPEDQRFQRQLWRGYGGFAAALIALVVLLVSLELYAGLSPVVISWLFLLLTVATYAGIGLFARSRTLDEYYVASRRVSGGFNGLATGSDWMSAASFISMAGTLWLLGYEGLAYILGWTGGYVLLALLLAPYLRAFGQYTVADFIGTRYGGGLARVAAAVTSIIICFTYVTAQITGVGIIMSRFLGVNYTIGVMIGMATVLLCSFLGGMKAVTWTQVAQGIILVIAYLVPVTWLAFKLTGVPFPQLMYGQALNNIERLELAQGITHSYVAPFNDWSSANFLALVLCLMLGTAGMPHILVRFYTVRSVRESRSSVGWALLWISLLYFTAPAYAAFSRWEILENVVGQPMARRQAGPKPGHTRGCSR